MGRGSARHLLTHVLPQSSMSMTSAIEELCGYKALLPHTLSASELNDTLHSRCAVAAADRVWFKHNTNV
jgi:hypothetical protein